MLSTLWCWYGLTQLEAEADQGKTLAAGTTLENTAFCAVGVPTLAVQVVSAAVLLRLGWRARGTRVGVLTALVRAWCLFR